MDLDARMAEVEARVRALDAITFGETEHGNIPADEYFAAREAGGELGQAAYEEQATRQRATEEDWNRLLADQLAKKQAETRGDTIPETAYLAELANRWHLTEPGPFEPGYHPAIITKNGSLFTSDQTHEPLARQILLTLEPQLLKTLPTDEYGTITPSKLVAIPESSYEVAVKTLLTRTGWVRVGHFLRGGEYPRASWEFTFYQKPTAPQLRTIRQLLDAGPIAADISVAFNTTDSPDIRGDGLAEDYAGIVRFLREHALLPAMADIADELTVSPSLPEEAYKVHLLEEWQQQTPETWGQGPHSAFITTDGEIYGARFAGHYTTSRYILNLAEPELMWGDNEWPITYLQQRTGWIRVSAYKRTIPDEHIDMGMDLFTKPTPAQLRAIRRLIESQPGEKAVHLIIHTPTEPYPQHRRATSYADAIRSLRELDMLPETMADVADEGQTFGATMPTRRRRSTLADQLLALRAEMAERAQTVYDEWEQDEEGYDPELGYGGICDRIAEAIGGVALNIPDIELTEGGQEGDDHAWAIVYDDKEAFGVDISPHTYESGGGYSWQKIPGVTFTADDVDVFPIDRSALGEDPQAYGATLPAEAHAWQLAETGIPITLNGYRGTGTYGGLTPKQQVQFGREYLLGEGVYIAPTPVGAGYFGTSEKVHITFHKPYVLSHANGRVLRILDIDEIRRDGYDGIIIKRGQWGFGPGQESLTQAVVFPEYATEQFGTGHVPVAQDVLQPGVRVRILPLTGPKDYIEEFRHREATQVGETGVVTSVNIWGNPTVQIHGRRYHYNTSEVLILPSADVTATTMAATLAENPELTGLVTDALASEYQAISMYDNIVGKAGLGDNETRLVAESILVDEKEHADKLDSLLRQPDTSMPQPILPPVTEECGPEAMPAAIAAQCEQEAPIGPSGDVAEWVSGMTGSPGIVVDAEEAGRYPCIRIQLRPGHNLVYQKGIVGPLDADQQALYCQQGYTEREPTEKQRERMAAMSDAAKLCKVESAGGTTQEHLVRYFACLGRELKTKGVNL